MSVRAHLESEVGHTLFLQTPPPPPCYCAGDGTTRTTTTESCCGTTGRDVSWRLLIQHGRYKNNTLMTKQRDESVVVAALHLRHHWERHDWFWPGLNLLLCNNNCRFTMLLLCKSFSPPRGKKNVKWSSAASPPPFVRSCGWGSGTPWMTHSSITACGIRRRRHQRRSTCITLFLKTTCSSSSFLKMFNWSFSFDKALFFPFKE